MRLVVLMIEVEQPEGLSARKLVLETSKHNVLTTYNGGAGIQMLKRFPNVDVVVVHVDIQDQPFEDVIRQIRTIRRDIPIIVLSPIGDQAFEGVDFVIPSHEPQAILKVLKDHYHASTSN